MTCERENENKAEREIENKEEREIEHKEEREIENKEETCGLRPLRFAPRAAPEEP